MPAKFTAVPIRILTIIFEKFLGHLFFVRNSSRVVLFSTGNVQYSIGVKNSLFFRDSLM